MPPQGLLLIAAVLPTHWEVRFIDENMGAADGGGFRLGRHRLRQRHAYPAEADAGHLRARPCGGQARRRSADRRSRPARSTIPSSTICMSANWAMRPTALIARSSRERRAPRPADRADDERAPRARRVSGAGLRTRRRSTAISSAASSFRAAAPITANSATFPAFTAACRACKSPEQIIAELDSAARLRRQRLGLFRRRQFRRQPHARCAICCRISSHGKSATATPSASPARRRSTSPARRTSWR